MDNNWYLGATASGNGQKELSDTMIDHRKCDGRAYI
jgi:hypothetical protein